MEAILHKTFSTLGFSKEFLNEAHQRHFAAPADMLKLRVNHLEALGFSQNALYEFVRFLEKEKLADLLNEF